MTTGELKLSRSAPIGCVWGLPGEFSRAAFMALRPVSVGDQESFSAMPVWRNLSTLLLGARRTAKVTGVDSCLVREREWFRVPSIARLSMQMAVISSETSLNPGVPSHRHRDA